MAELIEIAPGGFEEIDDGHFVEFALYGAPGELPELPRGRAHIGGVTVEVAGEELADDWADRWKAFHRPVTIGDRLHVRPPWTDPEEGCIDIVIDPGQAFGTGAHPTTQMCLEILLDQVAGERGVFRTAGLPPAVHPRPLADLGCGSGVLAISAAKLGFAPIVAVDNEAAAVEATHANADANGVLLDRVERCDLRTSPVPIAEVTVANLVRPLLLEVAALMPEQPETLIVSGLLEGEEDEVAAAFAPLLERPPADPALDVCPRS
jgi:ribosomal protein L11 methyltransferase